MRIIFLGFFLIFSINSEAASQGSGVDAKTIYETRCAGCHTSLKNSTVAPILFGQESKYIELALVQYASEKRNDTLAGGMMTALAKGLSLEEIKALAFFLAAKDPCDASNSIDSKKSGFIEDFRAGKKVVADSNCMHCHGSFHHYAPRIVGQRASYLEPVLKEYAAGSRGDANDHGQAMMQKMAASLTEEELRQAVTYLSGLRLMRACQ
jgi:cytochrome c553